MMERKPKILVAALTDCEGCLVSVLNLGQRFIELLARIEIVDFSLIEEQAEPKCCDIDIAVVEGCPITEENLKRLKDIRIRSRILVALGACAHLGGVAEIKNYKDRDKVAKYVYKKLDGIENPEIKGIGDYVKVDFVIPGCPISKEEFWRIINDLLDGKMPEIPPRPVCFECPLKDDGCLLNNGKLCLGPIILAGCEAPCPQNGWLCDGCRGPLKEGIGLDIIKMRLKGKYNQEETERILERWGLKDNCLSLSGNSRIVL